MSQPTPGTKFGPYRVIRLLGEGGMGAVWEAVHEGLEKPVAIKTLREAQSMDAAARFVREGRAAARIRHPNVVDVTDVAVHDGTPYLVMALLTGEPLSAMIARSGPLAPDAVVEIALPVLDALEAAHALGVIHRDLKPDNVFITRSPSGELAPIVLDFGISKVAAEAQITGTSALMGTPCYMSPEQARGARDVTPASDQFSLGLVLYEALSGQRAIQGATIFEIVSRLTTCDFPPLSSRSPSLPYEIVAIVERMVAREPAQRFASLRDVGRALLPFASPRTRARWETAFAPAAAAYASTHASTREVSAHTPAATPASWPGSPQLPSQGTAPMAYTPPHYASPVSHRSHDMGTGTADAPARSFPMAAIALGAAAFLVLAIGFVVVVVMLVAGDDEDAVASEPTPAADVAQPSRGSPPIAAPGTREPATPEPAPAPQDPRARMLGTYRGAYDADTTFTSPRWPAYHYHTPGIVTIAEGTDSHLVVTGISDYAPSSGCALRANMVDDFAVFLPGQTCSGRLENGAENTGTIDGTVRVVGDHLTLDIRGDVTGTYLFQQYEGTYTGSWDCTRAR
jgi:serine/threonine protein kinase